MMKLARSFKTPTDCGHEISWNDFVDRTHPVPDVGGDANHEAEHSIDLASEQTCPMCQGPVLFVSELEPPPQDQQSQSQHQQQKPKMVYFKYGKMVYRLCVDGDHDLPRAGNADQGRVLSASTPSSHVRSAQTASLDAATSTSNGGGTTFWSWLFGSSTSMAKETVAQQDCHSPSASTAQYRIQSTLGISPQGLKILYKGKVLYPLPFSSRSSSTEADKQRQCELSDRLIELSTLDVLEPSLSLPPPVLLVMGTPDVAQQKWRSQEQHYQDLKRDEAAAATTNSSRSSSSSLFGTVWTTVTTLTVADVWYVVVATMRWGVHGVCHRLPVWMGSLVFGTSTHRHSHSD